MMHKKHTPLLLALLLILSSCTKGGGGSDSGDNGGDNGGGGNSGGGAYSSSCGTVIDGLKNPADPAAGQAVTVKQVVSSNVLILSSAAGDLLYKLFALEPSQPGRELSARGVLASLTSGPLVLFQPKGGCQVSVSEGQAISGQLFNAAGESIEEKYIKTGLAGVAASGSCGEGQVVSCYTALKEDSAIESAGDIFDFLWKPESDGGANPGSLVVLVGQCNVDVRVNGESLSDSGSGNGRCTTARGTRPGCAYGANVKVEVIDNISALPYLFDGDPFLIIPNGCSRVEFVR